MVLLFVDLTTTTYCLVSSFSKVSLALPSVCKTKRTASTSLPLSCTSSSSWNNMQKQPDSSSETASKQLILIRHGCTYMNEYLSTPGNRWGDPNFTDVFHPSQHARYKDSPLSQRGKDQAQELYKFFKSEEGRQIIENIDLVAVSPLTRAIQTTEIALWPHLQQRRSGSESDSGSDSRSGSEPDSIPPRYPAKQVPVVALPLATERVYLISDQGKCRLELSEKYTFVDFEQGFQRYDEEWWFTVQSSNDGNGSTSLKGKQSYYSFTSIPKDQYREWRPSGENQIYSCPGEPDECFVARMMELYKWLQKRQERVICLVCHWGVLEWLTGRDFENCEVEQVSFDEIKAKVLSKR